LDTKVIYNISKAERLKIEDKEYILVDQEDIFAILVPSQKNKKK